MSIIINPKPINKSRVITDAITAYDFASYVTAVMALGNDVIGDKDRNSPSYKLTVFPSSRLRILSPEVRHESVVWPADIDQCISSVLKKFTGKTEDLSLLLELIWTLDVFTGKAGEITHIFQPDEEYRHHDRICTCDGDQDGECIILPDFHSSCFFARYLAIVIELAQYLQEHHPYLTDRVTHHLLTHKSISRDDMEVLLDDWD